jgi:hypothetical protein
VLREIVVAVVVSEIRSFSHAVVGSRENTVCMDLCHVGIGRRSLFGVFWVIAHAAAVAVAISVNRILGDARSTGAFALVWT